MNTSNLLKLFKDQQKSHVAILGLNRRFGSFQIFDKRKRVSAFIRDETILQICHQHFWLSTCIEPIDNTVLGIYISIENMFVIENFIGFLYS